MVLLKSDIKILKYISHHKAVSRGCLCLKYSHERIDQLESHRYLRHDYVYPKNSNGFPVGSVPDTALYSLTEYGLSEIEKRQWFNVQYVLTQIILSIVIAIITTLITLLAVS